MWLQNFRWSSNHSRGEAKSERQANKFAMRLGRITRTISSHRAVLVPYWFLALLSGCLPGAWGLDSPGASRRQRR